MVLCSISFWCLNYIVVLHYFVFCNIFRIEALFFLYVA